jgi:hypothetical protein
MTTSKIIMNWLLEHEKDIPWLANLWNCSVYITEIKLKNDIFFNDEIEKLKKLGCEII